MGSSAAVLAGAALVATAERIARVAHLGQFDEFGEPLIVHSGRVARQFNPERQPWETAVAWLHDVLDGTVVSAADLLSARIPCEVVTAVVLLSARNESSMHGTAAERIRSNRLALSVKAAEIAVLADPARVAKLTPAQRERIERRVTELRDALNLWSALRVSA